MLEICADSANNDSMIDNAGPFTQTETWASKQQLL